MRVTYQGRGITIKNTLRGYLSQVYSARSMAWVGLTASLIVCDILMTGLALRFAYLVRFELGFTFFDPQAIASPTYYENLVRTIIPIWLVIFALYGLYNRRNLLGGTQEYDMLFQANTFAMFSVVAVGFFEPGFVFARGWIILSWLSAFAFCSAGRFVIRRMVYMLREQGLFLTRAIIVGYNDEAYTMAEQLMFKKNSGLELMGIVDDHLPDDATILDNLSCMGSMAELSKVIEENKIEDVILTSSALSREEILEIFEEHGVSNRTRLRMSSGLYEMITTGLQVKEIAWVPLVEVNKVRLTGTDRFFKAVLDYSLTIPGIIVLMPVFLLIAAAIRLDSPGPVLHRRRVLGVNGRAFDAFKFRTMHVNGDEILARYPEKVEELARTHKLKDDPRVTRVGHLLRKTSLDELPQLFNVLLNEMSLVGPRMIAPLEVQEYSKWGINLLTVKPGITGKWQVSGRSDITYQDRVRMDMYYIQNWNIWMDLQLLIQTIPAVVTRRGAY
jgi:exopolysaccharide biosynthesis polyprenyl glycosylphosphotransferase